MIKRYGAIDLQEHLISNAFQVAISDERWIKEADHIKEVERLKGGWISVDDRLPEKHDFYDVWIAGDEHEKPRRIPDVIYSESHGGWVNGYGTKIDLSVYKITHWMPLPEPPGDV